MAMYSYRIGVESYAPNGHRAMRCPLPPGPVMRIRRVADGAEIDLYSPSDGVHVVDNPARDGVTTWLAGSAARVVAWYNQETAVPNSNGIAIGSFAVGTTTTAADRPGFFSRSLRPAPVHARLPRVQWEKPDREPRPSVRQDSAIL